MTKREYKIQGEVRITCACGFEIDIELDDWTPLDEVQEIAEEKAEEIHYWTEEDCPACRTTEDQAECEKADALRSMELV
jgi:hypothetical protein